MENAGNTQRVALGVEYNGAGFHGWQRQKKPAVATVQAELEGAISQVANHPVAVVCAGRTDAGVHATQQVVHFETTAQRELRAWVRGVNSHLPETVRVCWSQSVDAGFHARFSAVARRYQYLICNTEVRPAIFSRQMVHFRWPLDTALMQAEANCLLGEQDFSSFQAVACQSKTAMRNVHHVTVSRKDHLVMIDIQANAFLLHMVRNIAGVLMAVGAGQKEPGWTRWVLAQKDRNKAGVTAHPQGLYLVGVEYPRELGIPQPGASALAPINWPAQ